MPTKLGSTQFLNLFILFGLSARQQPSHSPLPPHYWEEQIKTKKWHALLKCATDLYKPGKDRWVMGLMEKMSRESESSIIKACSHALVHNISRFIHPSFLHRQSHGQDSLCSQKCVITHCTSLPHTPLCLEWLFLTIALPYIISISVFKTGICKYTPP